MRLQLRLLTALLFCGACALSGGLSAYADDPEVTFKPRFDATKCPVTLPSGVRDGVDVRCGYVTVPERHAQPNGKTIQLAVAVVQADSDRTVADPIVILDGGPGLSSISATLPFVAGPDGQPLRETGRDLVLIEQRGNYYSKPALTCPEVFAALQQQSANLAPPPPGTNVDLRDLRRGGIVTAYTACRDRLRASGVNLSAFNGIENAADIPMVVKALNYDRYNIYAVSYGTQLAQHLLRDHPQGIRSVVLNSVLPLDVNVNTAVPVSAQRAFDLLFETCRQDSACSTAFPNLEDEFNRVVSQAKAKPLLLPQVITGNDIIRTLADQFTDEDLPDLPLKIHAIATGDTTWLANRAAASGGTGTEALGLLYSTVCAEDSDFTRNDMALDTQIERAMAAGLPSDILAICTVWNVDKLPPIVDQAVVSDVPTILMAGEFDVITPPEFLPRAGAGLSKSYRYRFPGGGHAGIDACKLTMMLAFIEEPTKAPSSACIATLGVHFNTPKIRPPAP